MRSLMRFNMVMPELDRAENGRRHQAMLEMCRYGDANGFSGISLEEHHGAFNGWSSSPLILAGLIFGASTNLSITISALLVPLHDPIRIAEDIAALDLASGGRLVVIAGIGYRPEETPSTARTGLPAVRRWIIRSRRCSAPGPASRSSTTVPRSRSHQPHPPSRIRC